MRISDWSSDVCASDLIVEEGFAERAVAADQQDRLGRDALARHVEEHEGDALIFVRLVGADEAENPVGLVGVARPDLRPVDDPMIALVLTEGLQGPEIAARARFEIALRSDGRRVGTARVSTGRCGWSP